MTLTRSEQQAALTALSERFEQMNDQWSSMIHELRETASCPSWCSDHTDDAGWDGAKVYHSTVIGKVLRGEVTISEVIDVRTDASDGAAISAGDDELTPSQARQLAGLLLRAADLLDAGELVRQPACGPDEVLDDAGGLARALGGERGGWRHDLLRLIGRSDAGNRRRLALAYPRMVRAYELWEQVAPVPAGVLLAALDDPNGSGRGELTDPGRPA